MKIKGNRSLMETRRAFRAESADNAAQPKPNLACHPMTAQAHNLCLRKRGGSKTPQAASIPLTCLPPI
ncbi:hypothetical protein TH63_09365 [Rufibacter radiotolerans]|uniref:Uncharacterized protein n=1 Tax=Rufibacter radiotolerans TaxID=1379910 RepID=A0A0H4VKC3_9BACT|nr:hypothetical protein TH63_09365 [Rufibacter radiotolerans]